ncbi:protein Mpv17-like [Sitophilus oryzae]|uniref:Mitochondrial inner membrane protein Mpv17 n=1 Tax=Sitophilus oryzae TaxID=7048 RepID=A0A6J2X2C5_SITOR|nr:protein Mpv17-like [Sitophilus oryzae]
MLLGKTYARLLKNHFLLMQSVQTALLMSTSDILAQFAVEKKTLRQYEPRRTAEFAFLGAAFVGPALSIWYKVLQRKFGSDKTLQTGIKKMSCDQLLFAPVFLLVFVSSVEVLHGNNMEGIKDSLRKKYKDIVITNWKIWPAVQMINFSVMPLKYQVLFAQFVAVFWNVYLSWKTQNK